MKVDEIRLLYDYNFWADQRILATCANVSREQYIAATSTGRSLRGTVVHILDSARGWRQGFQKYFVPLDALERERTEEAKMWHQDAFTEGDLPTLSILTERWQIEERSMRTYLGNLRDADLNGMVRYRVPEGFVRERVLWHCLLHVVNHGTQHRSEAAMLLTSYGQTPGGLDFTAFLNEHLT